MWWTRGIETAACRKDQVCRLTLLHNHPLSRELIHFVRLAFIFSEGSAVSNLTTSHWGSSLVHHLLTTRHWGLSLQHMTSQGTNHFRTSTRSCNNNKHLISRRNINEQWPRWARIDWRAPTAELNEFGFKCWLSHLRTMLLWTSYLYSLTLCVVSVENLENTGNSSVLVVVIAGDTIAKFHSCFGTSDILFKKILAQDQWSPGVSSSFSGLACLAQSAQGWGSDEGH